MKSPIVAFCMLLLGIAIGFLIASLRPRHIPMAFSSVGELYIHPKKGDVIQWSHGAGDLRVKFKYGQSPCVEGLSPQKCTISSQAVKGNYFYDCAGCPDPGIGMGGETGPLGGTAGAAELLPPPYTNPAGPRIWCQGGASKGDTITGKAGESFELTPVGEINYSVSFPTAGTCSQGNPLNNGSPDCTLTAAATFPQNYSIHIDGCTDGTGVLKAE